MSDLSIRIEGRAGRITLTRPKALNALSYEMCLAIEDALDAWTDDDSVALVIIDAEGDKAFCAGGDIQELYSRGRAGDMWWRSTSDCSAAAWQTESSKTTMVVWCASRNNSRVWSSRRYLVNG